jgi:exodeoxyribonuclease III
MSVFCATDYQIAAPGTASKAASTGIYKDERFSDHAPLTVDYDL